MRVKIINLNAWYGGRYTWDNIVSYLREEKPDIVFLQEAYMSDDPDVPVFLRTVSSLADLVGFPFSESAPQFTQQGQDLCAPVGNAILSKLPLTLKNIEWLQGSGGTVVDDRDLANVPDFPRNLLHCRIVVGENTYNLINLQGVWAFDGTETERQRKVGEKIKNYIADAPNVILAGDFNVNEYTESVHMLQENLVNVFKGERTSSFNMTRKKNPGLATAVVDFVFTSPSVAVVEHYTPDVDVSDHMSQVIIVDL